MGKCGEEQHAGWRKGTATRAARRMEDAVIGPTHPSLMVKVAATQRAAIHADVNRCRLMHLSRPGTRYRQHWADVAALAIVVVTAVWIATGFAAPNERTGPARSSVEAGDRPLVTQFEERPFLDPLAAPHIDSAGF
jgi:hypothetical protein